MNDKPKTVKVKFSLSIGLVGCTQEEIVEFDRKEWEAMTEEEKDHELKDWMYNHIDAWYDEEEEDDE